MRPPLSSTPISSRDFVIAALLASASGQLVQSPTQQFEAAYFPLTADNILGPYSHSFEDIAPYPTATAKASTNTEARMGDAGGGHPPQSGGYRSVAYFVNWSGLIILKPCSNSYQLPGQSMGESSSHKTSP